MFLYSLIQIQSSYPPGLKILLTLSISIGWLLRVSMFLLIYMSGLTSYLGKLQLVVINRMMFIKFLRLS